MLLYGTGGEKIDHAPGDRHHAGRHTSTDFEGIVNNLERRFRETSSQLDAGGDRQLDEQRRMPRAATATA